jgi:hypothetical protein
MPLTRLNDSAFDAQLEGVYFGMWTGSTSVRCLVTHAALTDKSQGSGPGSGAHSDDHTGERAASRDLGAGAHRMSCAIEKDADKLVSKLERAVDKGNATPLVSFLVFDAVHDSSL